MVHPSIMWFMHAFWFQLKKSGLLLAAGQHFLPAALLHYTRSTSTKPTANNLHSIQYHTAAGDKINIHYFSNPPVEFFLTDGERRFFSSLPRYGGSISVTENNRGEASANRRSGTMVFTRVLLCRGWADVWSNSITWWPLWNHIRVSPSACVCCLQVLCCRLPIDECQDPWHRFIHNTVSTSVVTKSFVIAWIRTILMAYN